MTFQIVVWTLVVGVPAVLFVLAYFGSVAMNRAQELP